MNSEKKTNLSSEISATNIGTKTNTPPAENPDKNLDKYNQYGLAANMINNQPI